MTAKTIRVSNDGTTFYTLPGNTGSLDIDTDTTDDAVFGQNFTSTQVTLANWTISSNGFFKGFPGYRATIKRVGEPTALTDAATEESNGGWHITNRSQSILDVNSAITVSDATGDITDQVESFDYLQGGVTFDSGFTPDGAVTISGSYLPTSAICKATSFSLGQTADTENITDFCKAQENGGFSVFAMQQQTVELSTDGFYSEEAGNMAELLDRSTKVIEINPDGEGLSVARGYFMVNSTGRSGDVGSTETETVSYMLQSPEGVSKPFAWYHDVNSSIPQGVLAVLNAWENREELFVEYKVENATLKQTGKVIVTDVSLDNSVTEINDFTMSFQGTDTLTDEPV